MHFVTEGFLKTGGALAALLLAVLLLSVVQFTTGYNPLA